jgi:uncharacterized protein YqjF (DUF2071 family)
MQLRMTWANLAFLHWRLPIDEVRARVPAELTLDLHEGDAWLGITPFEMRNVHLVGLPAVPTARDFPELNVRTYVRLGDRAGVYFFSLDAASLLAAIGARVATGLPYFHAGMSAREVKDDVVYSSDRVEEHATPARFRARYRPAGDVFRSQPGSLEYFLTERYSLFVKAAGVLRRLDIEHVPWPLQPGSADIEVNTMAQAAGFKLPADAPHVLFSRQLSVVAHWPRAA